MQAPADTPSVHMEGPKSGVGTGSVATQVVQKTLPSAPALYEHQGLASEAAGALQLPCYTFALQRQEG